MRYDKIFRSVFITAAVANCWGNIVADDLLAFYSKPLIVPGLLGFYVLSVTQRHWYVISALLFCWVGDVLLMFVPQHALFFMAGLVAFLVGHVMYILSYTRLQLNIPSPLLATQQARFAFPIVLATTGLLVILFPTLGALQAPVAIYALVIMMMSITAMRRYGRTSANSFWLVMSGALLFMLSDTLLALNKFYAPFYASGFCIMLTYCGAQWLIVEGLIAHQRQYS